jgi:hypothetical protein
VVPALLAADKIGDTDARSFTNISVPVITIHSLTRKTLAYLHTPADQIDKIQFGYYFQTYQLITAYLAFLDGELDGKAGEASGQ